MVVSRLISAGVPVKIRTFLSEILKEMAPRKNYTLDQLEKAVEAVKNGEKIAVAAKRFGIPRISLHDKISGKTQIGCVMRPSTVLTKGEEDILEKWILALSERHIPLTKDSLLHSSDKGTYVFKSDMINKRGFYRIPEIDKYLTNMYDF